MLAEFVTFYFFQSNLKAHIFLLKNILHFIILHTKHIQGLKVRSIKYIAKTTLRHCKEALHPIEEVGKTTWFIDLEYLYIFLYPIVVSNFELNFILFNSY